MTMRTLLSLLERTGGTGAGTASGTRKKVGSLFEVFMALKEQREEELR